MDILSWIMLISIEWLVQKLSQIIDEDWEENLNFIVTTLLTY